MFQCDVMIERYEDVIEDWYKGSQEEDLTTYLCEKHVLKGQDAGRKHARTRVLFCVSLPFNLQLFFYYSVSVQPAWTRSGAR